MLNEERGESPPAVHHLNQRRTMQHLLDAIADAYKYTHAARVSDGVRYWPKVFTDHQAAIRAIHEESNKRPR
jgi:hypothetical protein